MDSLLLIFIGACLIVVALVPNDIWKMLLWLGAVVGAAYVAWICAILLAIRI
jgi:hypothetical protein